jgi:hypothetical protein
MTVDVRDGDAVAVGGRRVAVIGAGTDIVGIGATGEAVTDGVGFGVALALNGTSGASGACCEINCSIVVMT